MATGAGPTASTVLSHTYISQAGKEQGSISASVFTSEDGEPSGRWRAAPVYQPTEVTEVKADGQQYARHEGYIESRPGVYFGIVLQWRSKNGALTKTWKLDDDLVAYYYLDGRPLPCMRYAIYQPGGKNPLPLSGLWPDNDTRYPLRWEKRQNTIDSIDLEDKVYVSSDETCPVLPPLFSADDLGSIRITIHHKTDEEGSRYKKFEESPMPTNSNLRKELDLKLFKDRNLTESVGLQAPDHVSEEQLEDIFSGREAPAKSLPFLEFRLYYKNRETLERIGIMPETSSSTGVASHSRGNGANSASQRRESENRRTQINGHAEASTSSSHPHKRARYEENLASADVNGSRVAGSSRSTSPLPPPLSARPSATASTSHNAPTSQSALVDGEPPVSNKVKPEPQSSPNRNQADSRISPQRQESLPTPEEDMQQDHLPPDHVPSPPPLPDGESQQSSLSEFFNAPVSINAGIDEGETRRPTPSTSTSAPPAPPKAENPSPKLPPTIAHRTAARLGSPLPSQSQNSFFGNASQSQSAAQEARELEAEAFLSEDALDIAEPENVQALISVGFRTKKKFLSRLPLCDQGTRDKIFADLAAQMEALDFGVLRAYLLKHCEL